MKSDFKDSKHTGNLKDFTRKVHLIIKLFILTGMNEKLMREIAQFAVEGKHTEIRPEDVGTFLHRASLVYDGIIKICPQITYHIYCEYLTRRYDFDKAHAPGEHLAPATILSYFKSERAGEQRRK